MLYEENSVSELPGGCPKIPLPHSLFPRGRFYLAYDENIAMVLADFVVHETINLLWPRSKLIGKIIEDSKCFDSTNRIICFAFIFNFNSSNSPFHRQNTWWSFVRWLFESLDGILWCDHSDESSLPVLTHSSIWFSKFHREKFENLVEICFWLNLAVKGSR